MLSYVLSYFLYAIGIQANQIEGCVTMPAEKKSKWICGQMKNLSITFTSIDPTLPI